MEKEINYYKFLWCAAFVVFAVCLFLDLFNQRFVFFLSTQNFGADFFNTCMYVVDKAPYDNPLNGVQEKLYPPIAYIFHYPWSLVTDYHTITTPEQCWENKNCMLALASYTLISVAVWIFSVLMILQKYKISWFFGLLILCTSSIFLYTIERGNYILLSAALTNIFVVLFNNTGCRKWIAYISLAIASSLKVYPVLFASLLIRERKYKELLILAFITATIFFLPFLFFEGGFANVPLLIRNVSLHSMIIGAFSSPYRYGLIAVGNMIHKYCSVPYVTIIFHVANILLSLCSILVACVCKNKYYSTLLISFVVALFPAQAYVYNVIYCIPYMVCITTFIRAGLFQKQRKVALMLALGFIALCPFQIVYHSQSISYIVSNLCFIVLWVFTLLESMNENQLHGE